MARFTDAAKVAFPTSRDTITPLSGPTPPLPTASSELALPNTANSAQPSSAIGATTPTALAINSAPATSTNAPLIRSDQPQPQPRMQTSMSLPATAKPGANKAFQPPNKQSINPPKPVALKPPGTSGVTAKAAYLKLAMGLMPAISSGLGMGERAFEGGMVNKALGAMDAFGRAKTLYDTPEVVTTLAGNVRDLAIPDKTATHQHMPGSPVTGVMDGFKSMVHPILHPIDTASDFVSGLGGEADKQLNASMIEQPFDLHMRQMTAKPTIGNIY